MFIEILRAQPQAFPMIADKLFKMMNVPDAEELGKRFEAMIPGQNKGPPPELMQAMEKLKADAIQFKQEAEALKADKFADMMKAELDRMKIELDQQKVQIEGYKAETERMSAEQAMAAPLPAVQSAGTPNPGGAITLGIPESIGPAVAEAVAQAMANIPPLKVEMPPPTRMRRIPIRDQNGMILETRDEPIIDAPQGMMN
jgi:hypothetical protein